VTRHVVRLTAAFLALFAQVSHADEPVPRGQLPDDVIPQRYALTLTIDPRQTSFTGEVEIQVQLKKPSKQIWLHGRGLQVKDATLQASGKTLRLKYTEVDTLSGVARLDLPLTSPAGSGTLRLSYTADFRTEPEGLYRTVVGDDSYVFTQMQAIGARRAFPGFDDPQFKTPFEITVIAPSADKAVSNAPLASSAPIGNGMTRHRFQPTLPLPTELIALAVGPLDVVEGKPIAARTVDRAPIPLRIVATRGQGPKLAYALEHTPEIVLALEDYFRIAFPYPKLDMIASPTHLGAMENAGAIIFNDTYLVMDENAPPSQLRGFYEAGAHEIAHQWFGDFVTPRWWEDIWLNESFAEWMGIKIAHQLRPDLVPDTSLTQEAIHAMEVDSQSVSHPVRQPVDDNMKIDSTFDSITYEKGGGVLSMIESYSGPETFRRGVQRHLLQHPNGTATSDEFFAAMAAAAGQPAIVEAFRSFVSQPGLPLLTVSRKSATQLELTQSRYAPLGAGMSHGQSWTIPLCINFYGTLGARKTCALMAGATATMAIPEDIGAVAAVMPNADGAGYYRFALDERDSAALLERADRLPDREAMMLADSVNGGFRAGRVSLQGMLAAAAALSTHPNRQVSTQPGFDLLTIHDRMLDAPQRDAFRKMLAAIYEPRLQAIGVKLDAASNAADTPDVQLRRRSLVDLVGLGAREPALRRQLSEASVKSLTDPSALDLGLRDRAWAVAAQDRAPGVFSALVTAVAADDALARQHASFALGLDNDPVTAAQARELSLDTGVPALAALGIMFQQFGGPETRAPSWGWLQKNFDRFSGRMPGSVQPFIFLLLEPFCDSSSRDEVKAFGATKVRQLGTGEFEFRRSVESIEICMAQKAAHAGDFKALLAP
jgi:Peptidase family M1 domain/Peptidase M1 N-terminal domain/ERAP1-like C-terminal domain